MSLPIFHFFIIVILIIFFVCKCQECNDVDWCSISMPSISYFKFEPPTDPVRWKQAQILAASGRLVLLERISKVFPNPFDFLDGDRSFRRQHHMVDVFVDETRWLSGITNQNDGSNAKRVRKVRHDSQTWEKEKKNVVPYDDEEWKLAKRIPIVSLGKY